MKINPSTLHSIGLYGCGGTGSHVASGLARLEHAIRALGGDFPHVTLYDHDTVEEPNIGRQLYTEQEIGQHKSIALAHRINLGYGLQWQASIEDHRSNLNLICVDSRGARRSLYPAKRKTLKSGKYKEPQYGNLYLDFGNAASTGQAIFGGRELPTPAEAYPELTDGRIKDDNAPSCSLAQALESQELFVNQMVATLGLQILWSIFRRGRVTNRGYFFNLEGSTNPISLNF